MRQLTFVIINRILLYAKNMFMYIQMYSGALPNKNNSYLNIIHQPKTSTFDIIFGLVGNFILSGNQFRKDA